MGFRKEIASVGLNGMAVAGIAGAVIGVTSRDVGADQYCTLHSGTNQCISLGYCDEDPSGLWWCASSKDMGCVCVS